MNNTTHSTPTESKAVTSVSRRTNNPYASSAGHRSLLQHSPDSTTAARVVKSAAVASVPLLQHNAPQPEIAVLTIAVPRSQQLLPAHDAQHNASASLFDSPHGQQQQPQPVPMLHDARWSAIVGEIDWWTANAQSLDEWSLQMRALQDRVVKEMAPREGRLYCECKEQQHSCNFEQQPLCGRCEALWTFVPDCTNNDNNGGRSAFISGMCRRYNVDHIQSAKVFQYWYRCCIHLPFLDTGRFSLAPFPSAGYYASVIDPNGLHANDSMRWHDEDGADVSHQYACLFIGGLPVCVTTQQIFATIWVLTGISPVSVCIISKRGSDATSAWVLVPAAAADDIAAAVDKCILFDEYGWIVCPPGAEREFSTLCELRKWKEQARYQQRPSNRITCTRSTHRDFAAAAAADGHVQQCNPHDALCPECCRDSVYTERQQQQQHRQQARLDWYMNDVAPHFFFSPEFAVMPVHSNNFDAEHFKPVNWNAVKMSNNALRRCWITDGLHFGIGARACDAHRMHVPGAQAQFEFDRVWLELQHKLKEARVFVNNKLAFNSDNRYVRNTRY